MLKLYSFNFLNLAGNKETFSMSVQTKKNLSFLFFFFLTLFCLPSCYFNTSSISTTFSLPSVGEDFSAADSEVFYLDLDLNAYESSGETIPLYDINTTEIVGDSVFRNSPSNCELEYTPQEEGLRQSSDTKICILDAPEWAFTLKNLHLVVNVPEGMCETMGFSLPWHFNFPVIAGPDSIKCPVEVGDSSQELYCEATIAVDSETQAITKACPANASTTSCYEKEEDLCPSFSGGPKCCYGGENEDGKKWTPDLECFGGPALESTQLPPANFYVTHNVTIPENGLRQTISLTQLITGPSAPQNVPHANYLKLLDISLQELKSLDRNIRPKLPDFLKRPDFYKHTPNLFFKFTCDDPAHESQYELLLLIREWNTMEEFMAFYNSGGSEEGDPDIGGLEGSDCEYEERGRSHLCNDWLDLDDYAAIGSYPRLLSEENPDSEE